MSGNEVTTSNCFDMKKTLCALQNRVVITSESSPFKWVGSYGAGPCILILIQGKNNLGEKIAVCAHYSAGNVEENLDIIFKLSGIKKPTSVYLVSGQSSEQNPAPQALLNFFIYHYGVQPECSLGKGVSDAALNVETGEITYKPSFSFENAGERPDEIQLTDEILSEMESTPSCSLLLKLSIDGRNKKDVEHIQNLLRTPTSLPFQGQNNSSDFTCAFWSSTKLVYKDEPVEKRGDQFYAQNREGKRYIYNDHRYYKIVDGYEKPMSELEIEGFSQAITESKEERGIPCYSPSLSMLEEVD